MSNDHNNTGDESKGWVVGKIEPTVVLINLLPVNDSTPHTMLPTCPCGPSVKVYDDDDRPTLGLGHKAWDGRE